MAVYPVELVADTQEHDDTYAVAVYRSHGPRGGGRPLQGVTGIPTEASLAAVSVGCRISWGECGTLTLTLTLP